METLKIQVPEKITEPKMLEKEFTLPCFRKSTYRFIAVLSKDQNIEVLESEHSCYIASWTFLDEKCFSDSYSDCTEEEFTSAFQRVLERISKLFISR